MNYLFRESLRHKVHNASLGTLSRYRACDFVLMRISDINNISKLNFHATMRAFVFLSGIGPSYGETLCH